MRWLRRLGRLYRIQAVLLKHGVHRWLGPLSRYPALWLLYVLQPWLWRRNRGDAAHQVKAALIELGPVFVKFGQLISTRKDLFPRDLTEALSELQDKVPPVAGVGVRQALEAVYGQALDELFSEFEEQPMASASIAQVHAATLPDGRAVVVKWLRPNILSTVTQDLDLMTVAAQLLHRWFPDLRRFRLPEVVADYRSTLMDELDLRREAANQSQLRRNFSHSPDLYIPEVIWPLVRREVLVSERIHGIPVGDIEALRAAGTDMKRLAEKGVTVFFTQVFRDNFFHADMHPGNIFVDTSDPSNPCYQGVDCAIMGSLEEADQRYLADNFVAFFNRDYRRVAELHIDSGWVRPDTSVVAFEAAIRTACEPIFGRPLSEISFGHFLLHLFQVARRFEMEVQPQLVLLQKTLLYVEGLGRQLYPQLDLWQTAKPFLESWTKERMSVRQLWRDCRRQWPLLPQQVRSTLHALQNMPADFGRLQTALENSRRSAALRSSAWANWLAAGAMAGLVPAYFPEARLPAFVFGGLLVLRGLWQHMRAVRM